MLDSKQTAQVLANRERIRQGRLRTVTLIRSSGGATVYAAAQCTWKEEHNVSSGAANQSTPQWRQRWAGRNGGIRRGRGPFHSCSDCRHTGPRPGRQRSQVPCAGTPPFRTNRHAKSNSRQTCRDKVRTHANRR